MKYTSPYSIIFTCICLCLLSCSKNKYVMGDMLSGQDVDVTEYVALGYKPLYCDSSKRLVCRLIKPEVTPLDKTILNELQKSTDHFYGQKTTISNDITYKYSYIILKMTDVYTVSVIVNGNKKRIFFRVDESGFITPIQENEGWVL